MKDYDLDQSIKYIRKKIGPTNGKCLVNLIYLNKLKKLYFHANVLGLITQQ